MSLWKRDLDDIVARATRSVFADDDVTPVRSFTGIGLSGNVAVGPPEPPSAHWRKQVWQLVLFPHDFHRLTPHCLVMIFRYT